MFQPTRLKPLFHPGKLLVAPAAVETLRSNGVPVISVVLRHIAGDWGVVSEDDMRQNDVSIATGLRLISIYRLPDQTRILVITEWDRSNTTIERLNDVVPGSDARPAQPANRRYPAWPKAEYLLEGRA
ncbi:plasmid related protein [Burkholderia pseudomallei]|nr:plasmid related protein [Burkholderia pseudomallei]